LTRRLLAAVVVAAVALSACAKATFNARPADIYAAGPSEADVRVLLGDSNWWAGPPSFDVPPLDAATRPLTERYSVSREFLRLGTDEKLAIRYTVFDKASSATALMTDLRNALGASPSTPKVGDDVLYYGAAGSGGAPYVTRTFVRLGQILVTIVWTRKDPAVTVQQLGKNAAKVVDGLKKVVAGKVRASPQPVATMELPPPGRDITLLGATRLSIDAWVVMTRTGLLGTILDLMQKGGVTDFAYGDYALNNDTHMEVQSALLKFPTSADATGWVSFFSSTEPDQYGIVSSYIPLGGTPAAGEYHYYFAEGVYGGMLICKPTQDGEAASRECENPLEATAVAWKLALRS
jgi:hypothetical protein